MVCKNSVLDSFATFTRKHLYRSLLFKNIIGWLKANSDTGVFLWIVTSFQEHYFEDLLEVAVNNKPK